MDNTRSDRNVDLDNDREGSPNRDPLSGAPGAHPVGTGLGAAGAGAAGAAIGAVGGPVGSVAGAAIGAIVGGLIGKGVAEGIDPTVENEYWRTNYSSRPYYDKSYTYDDDYAPAYKYGWETRKTHYDKTYDDTEPQLATGWNSARSKSRLEWDKAKYAVKDAWNHVENHIPGDSDHDGH